jgi:hypothetical protein
MSFTAIALPVVVLPQPGGPTTAPIPLLFRRQFNILSCSESKHKLISFQAAIRIVVVAVVVIVEVVVVVWIIGNKQVRGQFMKFMERLKHSSCQINLISHHN